MKTLPIHPDIDLSAIPHIDRFCDASNVYLIETEADYALLPQEIRDARSTANSGDVVQ